MAEQQEKPGPEADQDPQPVKESAAERVSTAEDHDEESSQAGSDEGPQAA
jgi:hypothetical protein